MSEGRRCFTEGVLIKGVWEKETGRRVTADGGRTDEQAVDGSAQK